MSELFYNDIRSFSDFNQLTKPHHYHAVPSSWHVVMTDIQGSTAAIEEGRYKDVNILGSASIATVRNALKQDDFPFVFGGDGTTILIPASQVGKIKSVLANLQTRAKKQFNLHLRVSVFPLAEIYEKKLNLRVAKYEIYAGKCVAILQGSAMEYMENELKNPESSYTLKDVKKKKNANLSGLSCRWNSIPSQWGAILSLIIVSRHPEDNSSYDEVLNLLNNILESENHDFNPVNPPSMLIKTLSESLNCEKRYHDSVWSIGFAMRAVEICAVKMIFHFKIPLLFGLLKYQPTMRTHSDYRKFDAMLRMVIDCSPKQVKQIKNLLQQLHKEEKIYYGVHESESSLLTCFVQSVKDGHHIHFVDGDNGGYSVAAKLLKQQMKQTTAA